MSPVRVLPGRPVAISRRHRFAPTSTRRIHPGTHRIDVQVNGRVLATTTLEVHA